MSDDSEGNVLLADIGGTNARFAVMKGRELGPITYVPAAGYERFVDALKAYLDKQSERGAIKSVVLAVAGVVAGERCALTNNSWVVDAAELRAAFGFSNVALINDFEAIAWSLPKLAGADLCQIGGGAPARGAPMAVLGPGTGLGIGAYLPDASGLVLRSEGGHATLPGTFPREHAVIATLWQWFGHVSAERALSGPGLQNLYRAIAAL